MREFSRKEQWIIRERLIEGTTLPGFFTPEFLHAAKIVLQINPSGKHRLEVFSDTIDGRQANEELVDVVTLIEYLDKEGLVAKYPPAATTLRDFNAVQSVSIGDSESSKSSTFLMEEKSAHLIEFLTDHDNYFFKATEPLRTLNEHDFLSLQERQFARTSRLTVNGQFISIGIAISTLIATTWFNIQNWNRNDKTNEAFKNEILLIQGRSAKTHLQDSLLNVENDRKLLRVQSRIDSLITAIKEKSKPKSKQKNRNRKS